MVLLAYCAVSTARTQVGLLCSAALQYTAGFLFEGRGRASAFVSLQPLQCSVLCGPGEVTLAAVCFPLSRSRLVLCSGWSLGSGVRSEQSGQDPGRLVAQSIQVLSEWG